MSEIKNGDQIKVTGILLPKNQYEELQRKAVWYDRVHEPKEYLFDTMDIEELREELILGRHLIAEFSDAANVMPRELARLRTLAAFVVDENGEGELVKVVSNVEEDLRVNVNPLIRQAGLHPPDLCQKDLAQILTRVRAAMEESKP